MANKFIDQNGLRYFFSKLKRMFENKADKSDLKPVATSGKYGDLEGKPEIDTTVTEGSENAVSGGAVYTAINNLSFVGGDMVYVTISSDSDGNLTSDKSYDEIKSLIQANKEIIVIYDTIQFHYSYNGDNVLVFSSGAASVQFSLMCVAGAWNFVRTELASLEKVEKLEQVQINVIESNETFTADVTFEQIKTYYNDGRKIVVQHGNVILPLAAIGTNTSEEIMSFLFAQTVERSLIQIVCSDGIWFVEETELITALSVTTELSANSHNGEIPAAKTVYDSIQAVKETIPAVPSWALQEIKPTYTAEEVGAEAAGAATSAVTAHNTNTEAHNDMRLLIKDLTDRLNALADSDDTTLDQMSEIVAYIKNNKSLIDNITTTKVNVADIINNLTTNVADKPLSAAQGVALKALIDAITVPTALSQLTDDATHRTVTDAEKTAWSAKSNFSGSYNDLTNKPTILTKATNGFNGAICAGADGVAEYGKYCDFHSSADTTSDYSTRLTCTGDHKNNVNLPSATGTLLIGDKAYKIVTSSSAPTVNDANVITFVV